MVTSESWAKEDDFALVLDEILRGEPSSTDEGDLLKALCMRPEAATEFWVWVMTAGAERVGAASPDVIQRCIRMMTRFDALLQIAVLDPSVPVWTLCAGLLAVPGFLRTVSKHERVPSGPSYERTDPLWSASFMWWEVLPLGTAKMKDPRIRAAMFAALETQLGFPEPGNQLSGLHGLGHLAWRYPAEVKSIIARFLSSDGLTEEVRKYAIDAAEGDVD